MKTLRNIAIITLLATMIKSDIMILIWVVVATHQGLKLIIR